MTKSEFIKRVARKSGIRQDTVRAVLSAMFDPDDGVIISCVTRGDRLVLPGFGCFYASVIKEHEVPIPGTDQLVPMPRHLRMRFKPGRPIIEALKEITPPEDDKG